MVVGGGERVGGLLIHVCMFGQLYGAECELLQKSFVCMRDLLVVLSVMAPRNCNFAQCPCSVMLLS